MQSILKIEDRVSITFLDDPPEPKELLIGKVIECVGDNIRIEYENHNGVSDVYTWDHDNKVWFETGGNYGKVKLEKQC